MIAEIEFTFKKTGNKKILLLEVAGHHDAQQRVKELRKITVGKVRLKSLREK